MDRMLCVLFASLFLSGASGCRTFSWNDGTWREREGDVYVKNPPEQSRTAVTEKLSAAVESLGKIAGGKLNHELSTQIVTLFSHTERTVFLEFALFRLSEMAANKTLAATEQSNAEAAKCLFHEILDTASTLAEHDATREKAEANARSNELVLYAVKRQADWKAQGETRASKQFSTLSNEEKKTLADHEKEGLLLKSLFERLGLPWNPPPSK